MFAAEKWEAESERQRQGWTEQQQARDKRMFDVLQHQIADLKVQVTRPNEWQEAHHIYDHHLRAGSRRDSVPIGQDRASGRRESVPTGAEELRQADRQQQQDRVRQQELDRLKLIQNDLREREQEIELAAGAGNTLGSMLSVTSSARPSSSGFRRTTVPTTSCGPTRWNECSSSTTSWSTWPPTCWRSMGRLRHRVEKT